MPAVGELERREVGPFGEDESWGLNVLEDGAPRRGIRPVKKRFFCVCRRRL